jgi:hypothetical protein
MIPMKMNKSPVPLFITGYGSTRKIVFLDFDAQDFWKKGFLANI